MIEVTVPEGQGVGLAVIETLTPEKLFSEGGTAPIFEAIKQEVSGFVGDVSSEEGRKEIAAMARKIARSKTFIDEVGKIHNAKLKVLTKAVDVERGKIWDKLEALQAEIRKPLTEWEEKEKARVQGHKDALAAMEELSRFQDLPTTEQIRERISDLEKISVRDWEENAEFAATVAADLINALNVRLAASEKSDQERAELEKLRAEAAERERTEAARIAKEQEAARIAQAEEKARVEAHEAAQRAIAEAQAKAAKAEADRVAAEAKAEADRIEAEAKAAQAAKDAAERAEREKQEAIEAEKQRAAAVAKAEADATAARERDRTHKAKINGAAKMALVGVLGDEKLAESVIVAIAKGLIPNVRINY